LFTERTASLVFSSIFLLLSEQLNKNEKENKKDTNLSEQRRI